MCSPSYVRPVSAKVSELKGRQIWDMTGDRFGLYK
ncbi:MAG: hypothetical protein CM1200mP27_05480 [Chloroflexota bacterium]|nr:MAG: hypothetical protein CM1200mP27_05480 [Chloroflexota bacterium]